LEITEVRVALRNEGKLKAFVTITIDHCFVIRGLKVIVGATGMFVAMPARLRRDGTYQDIAHPINAETREMLETIVLAAYEEERRACSEERQADTGSVALAGARTS
jgi:stage V sporulation protein G